MSSTRPEVERRKVEFDENEPEVASDDETNSETDSDTGSMDLEERIR